MSRTKLKPLPSLRDRRKDILPLAETLLARVSADLGRSALRLDDDAKERLAQAPWPGNVRELANALERAAIMAESDTIHAEDLTLAAPAHADRSDGRTMAEIERQAIMRALQDVNGNHRLAAERLGIGVRTLYDKLKRYEIE